MIRTLIVALAFVLGLGAIGFATVRVAEIRQEHETQRHQLEWNIRVWMFGVEHDLEQIRRQS